jgi:uncharacterized protein YcgI (DUF1989 family)
MVPYLPTTQKYHHRKVSGWDMLRPFKLPEISYVGKLILIPANMAPKLRGDLAAENEVVGCFCSCST